jgi:hypothetical protein
MRCDVEFVTGKAPKRFKNEMQPDMNFSCRECDTGVSKLKLAWWSPGPKFHLTTGICCTHFCRVESVDKGRIYCVAPYRISLDTVLLHTLRKLSRFLLSCPHATETQMCTLRPWSHFFSDLSGRCCAESRAYGLLLYFRSFHFRLLFLQTGNTITERLADQFFAYNRSPVPIPTIWESKIHGVGRYVQGFESMPLSGTMEFSRDCSIVLVVGLSSPHSESHARISSVEFLAVSPDPFLLVSKEHSPNQCEFSRC